MRPAELFFRLGSALVGWLVIYAHLLMIAVIPRSTCSPDNPGLWQPTLITWLLTAAAILLVRLGEPFRDTIRWLTIPLAPLWLAAAWALLPYLVSATVGGAHVCTVLNPDFGAPAALWHRLWAPVQTAALTVIAWAALRYWRGPA